MRRISVLASFVLTGLLAACSSEPSVPRPTREDFEAFRDELRVQTRNALRNAPWSKETKDAIARLGSTIETRCCQFAKGAGVAVERSELPR